MKKIKMLKGAASFYIVAFSTLILVIIATSFATVILSEVTRTMNDDLSQSAYDSALAGVEDAKLAYANYRRCVEAGATATAPNGDGNVTCGEIVYWMENPNCDMVGHILGRIRDNESGEVEVSDTVSTNDGDVTNNLNQAYTCVEINTHLNDYRASLTSSSQVRVMKAEFENVNAAEIRAVRLSWYSNREGEKPTFNNMTNLRGDYQVTFMPIKSISVATPPTIEVAMVQTAGSFSFADVISASSGTTTDRATLYLVPTGNFDVARNASGKNYIGVQQGGTWTGESNNVITAAQVAKTNDRTIRNLPFGVWCPENSSADFLCSATIELPQPLKASTNGQRNDDTFMFVVTLPYAQPDTDFAMEFICYNSPCSTKAGALSVEKTNIATIRGAQVLIDSTGRANDLYRRVEVRLESSDVTFPYTYYAMEMLNPSKTESAFTKDMTVTSEYNNYIP